MTDEIRDAALAEFVVESGLNLVDHYDFGRHPQEECAAYIDAMKQAFLDGWEARNAQ